MYFREFGIPARIARAYSPEELEELVEKYKGKKSCYTSIYVFDNLKDNEGKPSYDSAIINGIWFDFDHNIDVSKCLMDVRKFINKYCNPRKITPRIYLTGGKGFQMNIDFKTPLDILDGQKRDSLREYITYLKKEYKLKTLDQACINNSVACLRRIPNTQYVSKLTGEPTGVWCVPLSVDEVMTISTEDAKERSLRLAKENGLFVGISSGANVLASERWIEKNNPDGIVVTILCDRGERYFSVL